MASTKLAKAAPVRRSNASANRLAKFKAHAATAARRTREKAAQKQGSLVSAATGAAIGYAEKGGYKLPTVAGIEPTLLWGGLLTMFGDKLPAGIRKTADAIGDGSLTVAGYKLGLGQPMILQGEDDSGTNSVSGGAGWENVP